MDYIRYVKDLSTLQTAGLHVDSKLFVHGKMREFETALFVNGNHEAKKDQKRDYR